MWRFNLDQQVLSSALIDYQQLLMYCKNKHTLRGGKRQNIDWAQYYWWVQDKPEPHIMEERPYDYAQHYIYMSWYCKRGMTTIWYEMNTDKRLSQPVLHPEEPMNELTYVPHSHQNAQTVSFFLFELFI
jgi:hypothetical protein